MFLFCLFSDEVSSFFSKVCCLYVIASARLKDLVQRSIISSFLKDTGIQIIYLFIQFQSKNIRFFNHVRYWGNDLIRKNVLSFANKTERSLMTVIWRFTRALHRRGKLAPKLRHFQTSITAKCYFLLLQSNYFAILKNNFQNMRKHVKQTVCLL